MCGGVKCSHFTLNIGYITLHAQHRCLPRDKILTQHSALEL